MQMAECQTFLPVSWLENFDIKFATKKSLRCAAILLTNIASITWITVNCAKPMMHTILCEKANDQSGEVINRSLSNLFCFTEFQQRHTCFDFLWVNNIQANQKAARQFCQGEAVDCLQNICYSVQNSSFGPVFNMENNTYYHVKKYLYSLNYIFSKQTIRHLVEGFGAFPSEEMEAFVGMNLFQCGEGGFVLAYLVCDGTRDCSDSTNSSDEFYCTCNSLISAQFPCKFTTTNNASKTNCSSLYYSSQTGYCYPFAAIDERTICDAEYFPLFNRAMEKKLFQNGLHFSCGQTIKDKSQFPNMIYTYLSVVLHKTTSITL